MRNRAEHLLADIRSLELRKATFADAQTIFERWRRWGAYKNVSDQWYDPERECTEEDCSFRVTLRDPFMAVTDFLSRYNLAGKLWGRPLEWYQQVGGRPAIVVAVVTVEERVVWGKWLGTLISVPPSARVEGRPADLIVEMTSVPRFYTWGSYPWTREWPSRRLHPEYLITGPTGCKPNCIKVEVLFTPYADHSDVEKLIDIDFSCLTRWTPCHTKEDIVPVAMAQDAQDDRNRAENVWEPACDPHFIEIVSRDTENVLIVDLTAVTNETGWRPDRILTFRVAERLKRATLWDIGSVGRVRVYEGDSSAVGRSGTPLVLQPGKRMILLVGYKRDGLHAKEPWLELCGALPLNDANLALVRRGIAQDERPSD